MTATNHAITGAIVAAVIKQPALALPLALASHFVLDALPHYGRDKRIPGTSRAFLYILASDAAIASALMLTIILLSPAYWWLIVLGALFAMSPDLMWLPRFLNELNGRPNKPLGPIARFHKIIQWGERPWGIYIEVVYACAMFYVLLQVLSPL